MRNYKEELKARVAFIREVLREADLGGIVFGNSGGKDSALVGILCKAACEDTVGVLLPCGAAQNFGTDMEDAKALAARFGIETRTVNLTDTKKALVSALGQATSLGADAEKNLAPRLRMSALYAIAASEKRLVAGTGNRSESYLGYFTKWGDGAYDFNPISDLTVSEIYAFLRFLDAPQHILEKAPSAGLFEGQTDEGELGVTYAAVDRYLLHDEASDADKKTIEAHHEKTAHKRALPKTYCAKRPQ